MSTFTSKLYSRCFPPDSYGKGVALLMSSMVLGQAAAVISMPILSRLYTPQSMGKMGLFLAFFNLASIGLTLRYEASIVAAKTQQEAVGLLILSLILNVFFSLVFTGIFFSNIKYQLFGFDNLNIHITWLMWLALFCMGLFQSLRFFLLRDDNYKLLSKATVYQNVGRAFAQVVLGCLTIGYLGLIIGEVFGRCLGIRPLYKKVSTDLHSYLKSFKITNIVDLAKANKAYPYFSVPSSFVDALAISLPIPLITQNFGVMDAGIYALASRALALPISLIGNSIGDVFHGQVANYALNKPQEVKTLFFVTAKKLFYWGLAPTLGILLLGPYFFAIIFGSAWKTAGIIAAIMAPWMFCQLIVSPLSRIIFVIGGQSTKLWYDFAAILAILGGIYGGTSLNLSFVQSIGLMSGLSITAYGLYFFILAQLVSKE